MKKVQNKLRKNRRKSLHSFTINHVFEQTVKVKMFGKIWLNGQDGYFYELDPKNKIAPNSNQYVGTMQPLEFVYRYMQAGYNIHGNMVCYRKHCYSGISTPLLRCMKFEKKK